MHLITRVNDNMYFTHKRSIVDFSSLAYIVFKLISYHYVPKLPCIFIFCDCYMASANVTRWENVAI